MRNVSSHIVRSLTQTSHSTVGKCGLWPPCLGFQNFRKTAVRGPPGWTPLSRAGRRQVETAENSQNKPWATGATMTVHCGHQRSLCADAQSGDERKTPRMFGICGRLPAHDGVKENRRRRLAKRAMAPRHGFEPRFTAPKAAVLPLDDRGSVLDDSQPVYLFPWHAATTLLQSPWKPFLAGAGRGLQTRCAVLCVAGGFDSHWLPPL